MKSNYFINPPNAITLNVNEKLLIAFVTVGVAWYSVPIAGIGEPEFTKPMWGVLSVDDMA